MAKIKRRVDGIQAEEGGFVFKKIKKGTLRKKLTADEPAVLPNLPYPNQNDEGVITLTALKRQDNDARHLADRQPNLVPHRVLYTSDHENGEKNESSILAQKIGRLSGEDNEKAVATSQYMFQSVQEASGSTEPMHVQQHGEQESQQDVSEAERLRQLLKHIFKAEVAQLRARKESRDTIDAVKNMLQEGLKEAALCLRNYRTSKSEKSGDVEVSSRRAAELRRKVETLTLLKEQYAAEDKKWQSLLQISKEDTAVINQALLRPLPLVKNDGLHKQQLAGATGLVIREDALAARRSIEIQVDGLESMLEGIEDICNRAEQMSSDVARDFHSDVFRSLPAHTPRTLIRRIAGTGM